MMTNVEIKLELAKALLMSGNAQKESLDKLYKWVVDENSKINFGNDTKDDYSSHSILEILQYIDDKYRCGFRKSNASSYFSKFIEDNSDIKTVGDLLEIGRKNVMQMKGMGDLTCRAISSALEGLYGIKGW